MIDAWEFVKWVIVILSPVGSIWWTWYKTKDAARQKQQEQGYTHSQAKDDSMRAFGEGVRKDEASQLSEITRDALKQVYTLTDGTLTSIKQSIETGIAEQSRQSIIIVAEINRGNTEQAALLAQVIASLNQTISQQERLLESLLGTSDDEAAAVAGIASAAIVSAPVQAAHDIAMAAVATGANEPGEITIAVTGPAVKGE